jgi:hypothetical protein
MVFFLASAITFSCGRVSPYHELMEGDLIFQANPGNDFVDAIEAVTRAGDSLMSFSHVGIIHLEKGNAYVIDASPENGVSVGALQDFLDSSSHDPDGKPLVRVMRYTGNDREKVCAMAVSRALSHIGKSYDFAFDPSDEMVYCSELVWLSFVDEDDKSLFRANPMTFKDSTGETSSLWVDYYSRLGKEIPEGVPGTNPNDMSREVSLEKVDVEFP